MQPTDTTKRCCLQTSALHHNLNFLKQQSRNCPAWAVIKANAYGHGLLQIARLLYTHADGLAITSFDDLVALRQDGCKLPILMLTGFSSLAELRLAMQYQATCVLHHETQLQWLRHPTDKLGTTLDVYLKINSGMNRLGFSSLSQHQQQLNELIQSGRIRLQAWMTHFANAGIHPRPSVSEQIQRFLAITHQISGHSPALSLANSAAILRHPDSHQGWIRPGIALYGASPWPKSLGHQLGLKPVMLFQAKLIAVQSIQAGQSVGYGSDFIALSAMHLGIVACGYADGYPYHLPPHAHVIVNQTACPVVGHISMSLMCIDLSQIPHTPLGTWVTLWGTPELCVDQVAAQAHSIGYELLTRVSSRIPRLVMP